MTTGAGPLAGIRVVELAGIGPGPFCAMMLADQGATVLRIDRPGPVAARPERDLMNRGRRSAVLDLKHPRAVDALLRLAEGADVLLEGFRPGVTERIGAGPEVCLRRNPRLIYARMTGWGQTGPLAPTVGHDIGYLARTGALHALGQAGGPPQFPANLLDGGVPWYDVYETADSKWLAVGALEPRFYAALLAGLGLTDVPAREDPQNWPELRAVFSARFKDRTRDEWAAAFAGSEACVEAVLSLREAAADPHLTARQTYVAPDGLTQPSPSPRFSRTPGQLSDPPPPSGQHTTEALTDWGLPDAADLIACGAALQA